MKYTILFLCLFSYIWGDTIYFKNGGIRSDVTVTEDNFTEVAFHTEYVASIKMDSSLVSQIEYSDSPAAFTQGKNFYLQKQYEKAIECFNESLEIAKRPPIVRDWIKQYGNFYIARNYHEWADNTLDQEKYKKAIAYYQRLLQGITNTRFLAESHFYKTQCYLSINEHTLAKESLSQMKSAIEQLKSKADWEFRLYLLQGDIFLQEKQYDFALEKYELAQNFAQEKKLSAFFNEAIMAMGNVYLQKKDFSKAENFFKRIQKESGSNDNELQAVVKNGLALCHLEQGEYLQARKLAVEVILQSRQGGKQQSSALFIAGQCYEKLAIKNPASLQAAKVYYELLRLANPDSEWGLKASQRLQEITKKK
ncbi:MAG: tetratricopeptide repeat protein [Candidatus Brocadiae bacterium]|nr:tetratricopeptide repeat protein [Candidatus Brocadiia bacterium]